MITKMTVRIHGIDNLQAVDVRNLVFHYQADSDQSGNSIENIHFKLFSEQNELMWDTGWMKADEQPFVSYSGSPLAAKTAYRLSVQAKDALGDLFEDNSALSFETGFLETEWKGQWIEPEQKAPTREKRVKFWDLFASDPSANSVPKEEKLRPAKDIYKSISCKEGLVRARLYMTAHGVYDFRINGNYTDDRRLAPEVSAYKDRLYYQTYDLTDALHAGENSLEITVADGWWIGRIGLTGDSCQYGDRLGVLFQIELQYEDGSREYVVSDGNEKSRDSVVRYADLFIGEKQDFTVEPEDYDGACYAVNYDNRKLTAQPMNPIVVTEQLPLSGQFYTLDGDLLLDFGQVFAGVAKLRVKLEEEAEIVLAYSEILDEKGNFLNNIQGRNKDQVDVFRCGKGEHTLVPRFTYHGLRYVRITGIGASELVSAEGYVIGSELNRIGHFHCSDERLNRLQKNILWSERSNMVSIPTDCPQREKMGWTGDIQVFSKTGCFNYDLYAFLRNWMENLRLEQRENGEVPNIVPNFPMYDLLQTEDGGSNSSPAWGDACIWVPYTLYQETGDLSILTDFFPIMEKWISYMKTVAAQKPEGYESFSEEAKERNPYLYTKGFQYGDWLIPSLSRNDENPMIGANATSPVVGSCTYAMSVECMMKISHVLGFKQKEESYRELHEQITKAVREEFLDVQGNVKAVPYQGVYVMLLAAKIPDRRQQEQLIKSLISMIRENGGCLDTGFVSIKYLMDVLCEYGYRDVAYHLLFQNKAPSWLYEIEKGATTIWENWFAVKEDDTRLKASYNHYAYGCVGDWIYRRIGGIQSLAPGYREIMFAPDVDTSITEAECSLDTVRGKVSCKWKKDEGNVYVDVVVPCGSSAVLKINNTEIRMGSGEHHHTVSIQ